MDKGAQAMGGATRNLSLAFPSLTKLQATQFTAIDALRTSLKDVNLKTDIIRNTGPQISDA